MMDDLYTGGNEVIRWNGKYSSPYQVKQGVKQGGILSPCIYKLYLYDLLDTLKKSDLGLRIGCTYVGTPTCADDVLHLASTGYELQSMLSFNGLYTDKHMYKIHPVKSSVTIMHQPTASPPDVGSWNLHWNGQPPTTDTSKPTTADPEIEEDQTITVTTDFTHLGLDWMSPKGRPDINKNVQQLIPYSVLGYMDGMDWAPLHHSELSSSMSYQDYSRVSRPHAYWEVTSEPWTPSTRNSYVRYKDYQKTLPPTPYTS